jgi:hypothetical protein
VSDIYWLEVKKMVGSTMTWKKGRGKLGIFEPLLGSWRAVADSPMGEVICIREFTKALDGAYIQLRVTWEFEKGTSEEIAFIGTDSNGEVRFWSFTSDKKQSQGHLADVSDIHEKAIGFEAEMPAGIARMAYWPNEKEGFHWVVESKTQKGWNRFTEHHYRKV